MYNAMRPIVLPAVSTFLLTGICLSAAPSTPVVSQVHVVSVHVPDHAAFDAVFLLFRDVLRLPRVYGELSTPSQADQRLYAGFSVGNAYLEPCGPYHNDAPFSADQRARFHGLTFSPGTSIADAEQALGQRSIPYSGVMGSGDMPRFVYLNDPWLTGRHLAVSVWEIRDTNDHVNFGFLRSSLQEVNGGALGVRNLEEVRVAAPGITNLVQWGSFLSPAQHDGDLWSVGNGPALRFVPGDTLRLDSIVLRVDSLDKAKAALSERNLVGKVTSDGVELDRAKTCGLRIVLRGR